MDNTNAFSEREKALENEFFHRVDQQLLEQLREKLAAESTRQALHAAMQIDDPQLLDELVALGLEPATCSALALAPLVLVAWADGKVDADERKSVLGAAHDQGIEPGSPCHELLERWLDTRPTAELATTWKHYVQQLLSSLTAEAAERLRTKVLSRARVVAETSGGVWEMGRISTSEKRVLHELDEAFKLPE